MSKKSLKIWHQKLMNNLWIDFLFYIAENEFTTKFIDELDDISVTNVFNKVYIIDKMLGPIEYEMEQGYKVFSKSKLLDDNIYLLLKMKRKLAVQEFDFLLEKYFKQAESCFLITNWIKIDISAKSTGQISSVNKGMFELQHMGYKEHFGKLIKYFYPNRNELPDSNFNLIEIIQEYFPSLLKENERINNDDIEGETQLKNTKKVYDKSDKLPLITEKEAEVFLLESVFGLKTIPHTTNYNAN